MRVSAAIFLCASLAHSGNPAQADGDRILDFGTDGVAVFTHLTQPDGEFILSVVTDAEEIGIQPDGSILVLMKGSMNYAGPDEDHWDTLTRFHADGSWDADYGEWGWGTTAGPTVQFPDATYPPADVAVSPDGSAVLVGTPTFLYSGNPLRYRSISIVFRILPNGVRDHAFGANGVFFWDDQESRADAVALKPNGHVLFAGQLGFGTSRTYVRELRSDGTTDLSFGDAGIFMLAPDELPTHAQSVNARLAVQDDGRVDLAALVGNASATFRHLRLLSDGHILVGLQRQGYWPAFPGPLVTLDAQGAPVPAFGNGDGIQEYPPESWNQFFAMEVDANGRILLADQDPDLPIKRLLPDGSLDESFGVGGYAAVPELEAVQALAIAPSGTIIAAGLLDWNYAAAHEIPQGSLGVIQFDGSASPDIPLDTLFEGGFEP